MADEYLVQRRSIPLNASKSEQKADFQAPEKKASQLNAAVIKNLPLDAQPSLEDYVISVEQVREHFQSKGLSKSKDTVQRWCRTGELNCRKSGVLGRYFTTETSLKALEKKLLPDMIAQNVGASNVVPETVQQRAALDAGVDSSTQLRAPENAPSRTFVPLRVGDGLQHDAGANFAVDDAVEVGRLAAEVAGLREQLKNRDRHIDFLHEEIRSSRDQRNSVVQISNRMLEALETMAIGGKLNRPKPSADSGPSDNVIKQDRL